MNCKCLLIFVSLLKFYVIMISILCVGLFVSETCVADILTVNHDGSADYMTISDAVAVANPGDIIDVACGVYSESFILPNGVQLVGQVIGDEPNDTVIDADQNGTAITIIGADSTTVIQGFTITNGSGTFVEYEPNQLMAVGGAILMNGSSPLIINCIISENSADIAGGIGCTDNSTPKIQNCILQNNTANLYGGAVASHMSAPLLEKCTLYKNTSLNDGGGFYAMVESSPTLRHCTFLENHADDDGGGMYSMSDSKTTAENCVFRTNTSGDKAGAFYSDDYDESTLIDCLFIDNEAAYYGGVAYAYYNSDITFLNCRFLGNYANNSGGGVRLYSNCSVTAVNCVFNWNHVWGWGGAIECRGSSAANITNCTFLHNFAMVGGAVALRDQSTGVINNSILWDNNTSGNGDQLSAKESELTVAYSVVEGGSEDIYNEDGQAVINYDLETNITDDPMVVDGNGPDDRYGTEDDNPRLLKGSPCIDTGSNDILPVPLPTDLDGFIRIADGDCNGMMTVDIGAHEFNHADHGDYDGQCDTDMVDFAIIAETWLKSPGDQAWNPICNMADSPDTIIDLADFLILCQNWLWDGQIQK